MNVLDAALAVASVLAGLAVGYGFRGWLARHVESRRAK